MLRLNQYPRGARHLSEQRGATWRRAPASTSGRPDEQITDDHIATWRQHFRNAWIETSCCIICEYWAGRATGCEQLALAGGVALNCTANGRLLQVRMLFDDVYVQPAAGDDGSRSGRRALAMPLEGRSDSQSSACRVPVPTGPAAFGRGTSNPALDEFAGAIEVQRCDSAICSGLAPRPRDLIRRRPGDCLVPRPHGIWPARPRPSQHPGRPGPPWKCATASTPW